jgi:hypothetical protein
MLYPVELRALTTFVPDYDFGWYWTTRSQICYHVRVANPADIFSPPVAERLQATSGKTRNTKSEATVDGRYKTRTCDLHDVNVAL